MYKYKDGWYWYDGKVYTRSYMKAPQGATMLRLWTGTTGRQQIYVNGRTRLTPRHRDMVLASGKLVQARLPQGMVADRNW